MDPAAKGDASADVGAAERAAEVGAERGGEGGGGGSGHVVRSWRARASERRWRANRSPVVAPTASAVQSQRLAHRPGISTWCSSSTKPKITIAVIALRRIRTDTGARSARATRYPRIAYTVKCATLSEPGTDEIASGGEGQDVSAWMQHAQTITGHHRGAGGAAALRG